MYSKHPLMRHIQDLKHAGLQKFPNYRMYIGKKHLEGRIKLKMTVKHVFLFFNPLRAGGGGYVFPT